MEQWISFVDARGSGYAQPDIFIVFASHVVCFEAKLTQCEEGLTQISQLYSPLLKRIFRKPVVGCLTCRNIVHPVGRYLISDPEVLRKFEGENIYTWHWNGR